MSVEATPSPESVYRKIGWRIIPLLMACYIVAFVDRANVGFAKLEFLGDLKFSEAVYGLGGGLFYLGYSLFEVPSNLLLARIGARRTLVRIMLLWSLCAIAMSLISLEWHFYLLRTLLGAAEAGLFPGVLLYLTYWAPASRRASFTALFMSAMVISGIIGGPISGAIMQGLDGAWGFRGWQWLFMVEGLPGLFLAMLVWRKLDDRPSEAAWLTKAEKAIVTRELASEAQAKQGHSHSSFLAALRDIKFYVLAGMSVALIAGIAGLFLWLPTIIRKAGFTSVWEVGMVSCVPFAVAMVTQYLVARDSDRTRERRWHAALPALVGAIGWLMLPWFSDTPWVALGVLTITAAGTFGATAPFWTMPGQYLSGTAAAGGIALITTLGGIGAFFAPTIVGFLTTKTGSLASGQIFYGALMALGALLLLIGTRGTQEQEATAPRGGMPAH